MICDRAFQVGGSLAYDAPSYVVRKAEGQPFLTQKLCQLTVNAVRKKSSVKENLVTDIVAKYIIDNWQSQDEPEHLRTIRVAKPCPDRLSPVIQSQKCWKITGYLSANFAGWFGTE